MVDVGIPTRGVSPWLAQAIDSVLAQTFTAWRLVVSQGGPATDELLRTLRPYLDDPRVSFTAADRVIGIGANHTRAIGSGTAPYVAVLHDDDRWHPTFLERRVAFMEMHPTCGFVCSSRIVIDETGRPLGRAEPGLSPGVHRSGDVWPLLYRENLVGPPSAIVMRRAAYEAVGGTYRDTIYCDYELWARLAARFDVGCLAGSDLEYRVHRDQMSATRRSDLAEEQFAVLDALDDVGVPARLRRTVTAEAHVRSALSAVERGERRRFFEHLLAALRNDFRIIVRPFGATRVVAGLAAMLAGGPGRRKLSEVRIERWLSGKGLRPLTTDDLASMRHSAERSTNAGGPQ
ncbi:MAG TPA: glycosyltransferase family 2 protein [Gaiellaceae bacterium]|nr:glycosyltransferase family 2 protein [Gaiellaceae bacterium]